MPFRILSLSGGGFMGLYTAAVLEKIEDVYGAPLNQYFDLIAGTSVGGIIALGLGKGVSSKQIKEAFLEHGASIFTAKPPPKSEFFKKLALKDNACRAKYGADNLKRTIIEIVGDNTKLGEMATRVIIPAVNLSKGGPQLFKTPHHPTFSRDFHLNVVDVALATSAAPTFFPLHEIDGELFADGGLFANAPDLLALHEAEHFLEIPLGEIEVLSIGTTTTTFSVSNSIKKNMGWMAWMEDQRLPNVMISTQQSDTDYIIGHKLGQRYLRIDREQSKQQSSSLSLDSASRAAKKDLMALAEASFRDTAGKGLARFFNSKAAKPNFFHEVK